MAKKSAIEIANTQRHLFLLRKVKENKALTRAELVELKRYERRAAGKMTAKAGMTSKVQPKKKKRKAAATRKRVKKKAGRKTKKKRRARPPVKEAEIRRLGLECEHLTEANAAINAAIKTRISLAELFKKHSELKEAWDHGRFLRDLRGLARTGIGIPEAAKKLGFANGRVLQTMLDDDVEVSDLWDQTRLQIFIEIKLALIEAAKEGKADAVRVVENFLLEEKERPGFDPAHITISQLTELTGKARQRIHEWHTKFGLQRNADKTFDLSIFLAWFEEFLLKKASAGKEPAVILDPLKTMKAEKLRVELARHRNETLDRNKVMISLVAWAQNLVSFCDRGNEELSRLCIGQPREKIKEIHKRFFQDLHAETARVPKELRLPDDKEKELVAFMNSLKSEKGGPGHGA